MAVVQLANVYNPKTFARRAQEAQTRLNRFLASGIVANDSLLQAQIAPGGNQGEMPFFAPLTIDDPNIGNDDPAVHSVPANITSKLMRFRGAHLNKSWSTMDFARDLALEDPLGAITNRVGHYWAANEEKRIIAACRGIMEDNLANDNGDMVLNVATDVAGPPTEAEVIGGDAVVDVLQTMGDHSFSITAIAMHSKVYSQLQKDNLIIYLQVANQTLTIPTYLGKRVIVDDSLPVFQGVNRLIYTTILFGGAVFGRAKGELQVPSEMERIPSSGNGAGQDVIHTRDHTFLHPVGFDFTSAAVAAPGAATRVELANGLNWDRAVDRKLIPLAFLQTNG